MNKSLYIFRHGETDWNVERRTQGWIDIPLNHSGIEQANDLAKVLEPIGLDIIYSSPLLRALETANIVAKINDTKILTNDDLRERNFGVLGGKIVHLTDKPEEEQLDLSKDLIVMQSSRMWNPDFVPENGESHNDLVSRSVAAILGIAKNCDKFKIGISTHGGVARSLISKFINFDIPTGGMPNATYFKLDWDGEKLSLKDLPDWLKSNQTPKGGE
ncbi:MAG TPA: histidine phosphatase family protein [Alphaproteobacteria bacterium]|nr:histidine phosphatase family protein [Alphaproteobacteria bacterium]